MSNRMKWLVGFLAVSVVLNIFVLGAFLGQRMIKPEKRYYAPPIDFNLKRFGEHLTKEERRRVRSLIKSQRHALSDSYKALRETEKEIIQQITAADIDHAALEAALKDHGARVQKLHAPLQNVLLEMVGDLDHETRQKLGADMFKRRHKAGKKPNGHRHKNSCEGDGRGKHRSQHPEGHPPPPLPPGK